MSTTTDILDTTIPEPAWVLDPTYDSELNPDLTHSRASAGRMVSDEGKYVSRASDVERVPYGFDGDPGLLVEAAQRTNQVPYSSAISESNWGISAFVGETAVSSIIDGKTAYNVEANTSTDYNKSAGTFSGNDETFYLIVEKDTADKIRLFFRNDTQGVGSSKVTFTFSTESINGDLSLSNENYRLLTSNGPNGGPVYIVQYRIPSGNSLNVQGEDRRFYIEPSPASDGKNTILHHVQIEEAPNASSPIVTGGSPTTRSADDYAIFEGAQPPWWNPNEGTFYAEIKPRFYYFPNSVMGLISNIPFTSSWIEVLNGSQPFNIRYNDGTNNDKLVNILSAYESSKVAVSVTENKVRLSGNGNSITGNHNGDLLSVSAIRLGSSNKLLFDVEEAIYFPRALSESTLNRITS